MESTLLALLILTGLFSLMCGVCLLEKEGETDGADADDGE